MTLAARVIRTSFVALLLLMSVRAYAAGGAQLQVYFQSNLASADYQKKVFDRVAARFKLPRRARPAAGQKAVVQALVDRRGKVVSSSLSTRSGSPAWDRAAQRAVDLASPLQPLPADFPASTVEVHFHFGWSGP